MKEKILLALSGGIDSAVAALLLQKLNYEVIACTIKMHTYSNQAIEDAKKVCDFFNIKHIVIDATTDFKNIILENFYNEYINGRTPNPCVLCNHKIKWAYIIKEADKLNIKHIATGHYASIKYYKKTNRYSIICSNDINKDQSYMLWKLPQNFLSRTIFPLSEINSKQEVRDIALNNNLPSFEKSDSQDICFIPNNDYCNFLENIKTETEQIKHITSGDFIFNNKKIGKHTGYYKYTIGQRRGMGLSYSEPLYVKEINANTKQIIVDIEKNLYSTGLIANSINLFKDNLDTFEEKEYIVKIRYKDYGKPAHCKIADNKLIIKFTEPRKAVTCGQSVVLYDNNELIGGGIIEHPIK